MKLATLLAIVLAAALVGCPGSKASGNAPPSHCTQLNERCSLGNGVLGVCSESRCAPGQAPPCIRCTSQH